MRREEGQVKLQLRTVHTVDNLSTHMPAEPATPWYDQILGKKRSAINGILARLNHPLARRSFARIRSPNFGHRLLKMEERLVMRQFKIGLLYARPGQSHFDEILKNNYRTSLG